MTSLDCYDCPELWDVAFGEDTALEADFIQAVLRHYGEPNSQRVLEVGCGGGRLVRELSRRSLDVVGWDLSTQAVDYGNEMLQAESLAAKIYRHDMRSAAVPNGEVDMAVSLMSTFRHLLDDDEVARHFRAVGECLRPGGIYVVGLHLFPDDADEEDAEEWTVATETGTIETVMTVQECSRETRLESLHFKLTELDQQQQAVRSVESTYRMRLYAMRDFIRLINQSTEFRLLPQVFDYWYDFEDPLDPAEEMSDCVFLLQKD